MVKSVQVTYQIDISFQSSKESNYAVNIIQNHDFSGGLHPWRPNSCQAFVVSSDSGNTNRTPMHLGGCYAVITDRKECWQGLEQDITGRVSAGSIYTVHACVGVSGSLQDSADVQATLKLEYRNSSKTQYLCIARQYASSSFGFSSFLLLLLLLLLLLNLLF